MSDRIPRKPFRNEDENNASKKFKPKRPRVSRSSSSDDDNQKPSHSSDNNSDENSDVKRDSSSFYERRGTYGNSDSRSSDRPAYPRKPSYNRDNNDRPNRDSSFNKDSNDRPREPYVRENQGGDRPYRKPFNREGGSGDRPYRKPYDKDNASGGKPPYRKSFGNDRNSGSRFDKKPYGKKPYEKKGESKEDYKKKKSFARPALHSYERKPENDLVRLNKFIANSGICSRREADDLITAGVISVNGKVVTELGTKVNLSDMIRYNNEIVKNEPLVYLLLNKPKDFITTMDDPEQRNTVMQLVASACKERIYPVGRLDRNTTGLLLFTNDGEMAKKLTHPSSEIRKVYHVELDRSLKSDDIEKIKAGVELEDGIAAVDDISYDSAFDDKSQVGIELHSGKNRIVRRIFETLGYDVKKLDRVVFAGLNKKDLPRGRWRFLEDMELSELKMLTSDKKKRASSSKKTKE